MSLKEDKIKTYLGFAVKSREFILGVDDIIKSKSVKVILVTDELSENTLKKLNDFANNKEIKIIVISSAIINELFGEKNIKALGVTNKNLADAIINL